MGFKKRLLIERLICGESDITFSSHNDNLQHSCFKEHEKSWSRKISHEHQSFNKPTSANISKIKRLSLEVAKFECLWCQILAKVDKNDTKYNLKYGNSSLIHHKIWNSKKCTCNCYHICEWHRIFQQDTSWLKGGCQSRMPVILQSWAFSKVFTTGPGGPRIALSMKLIRSVY